jgi:hypothetical protein
MLELAPGLFVALAASAAAHGEVSYISTSEIESRQSSQIKLELKQAAEKIFVRHMRDPSTEMRLESDQRVNETA